MFATHKHFEWIPCDELALQDEVMALLGSDVIDLAAIFPYFQNVEFKIIRGNVTLCDRI